MSENKIVEPRTLPGFMELLPEDQILFDNMKNIIEETYKEYGFLPMDNPIIGTVPFTIAIEYYILDITTSDNRSLFYIGRSTVNQAFGFEF